MGRYSGKTCRLLTMLCLTATFFVVEITVGYITNSLALVGDSYHMLSDVLALFIGFASVRISKWDSQKNTYGWARAEVLGALINAVFLIALCFTIFVEALERLTHYEEIHDPDLLLIVGGIGLAVNVIGLFLFAGHAHSHGGGGHGHSHGGGAAHGHSHDSKAKESETAKLNDSQELHQVLHDASSDSVDDEGKQNDDGISISEPVTPSSAQLNMKGVFLHVLGDALGSVIVIASALVIKFVEADWRYKVDPVLSIILVVIILSTAFPLFRESSLILLQTVPTHIRVVDLQAKLIAKVPGILAVHEFHIWQLTGNRIIASAHITCQNVGDYMRVAGQVKAFFHNEGIHSTTIQPEFIEYADMDGDRDCALECGPDKTCYVDTCCPRKPSKEELTRQRSNNTPPSANDARV